jgi:uncharacterized protein
MSFPVAKRGIDFVLGSAKARGVPFTTIAYHGGGEPSCNWAVLTNSLEYAKKKGREAGIEVMAYMATNGVLSNQQIEWIISNMTGASVAYDGLPAVHDKWRVDTRGRGSSRHVTRTLKTLDERGFPYGVRMTVTRDAIAYLEDSVEFICTNFGVVKIHAEPAFRVGRWRTAPSAEIDEFVSAFIKSAELAESKGKELRLSSARLGMISSHFCGVTQDNFCLTPSGSVTACYEVFSDSSPYSELFIYGRPKDGETGYDFDLDILQHLRSRTVEKNTFCQDCFARWTCSGECYHKAVLGHGDREFAGSDRCHIVRAITKYQILHRIIKSGGLFWQGSACTPLSSASACSGEREM